MSPDSSAQSSMGPDFPAKNTKGVVLFDKTGSIRSYPPECINTDGNANEPAGYSGGSRLPHKVEGGGSTTRRIGVFDDENVRGCIPPGVYPFELMHTVRPKGETSGGENYTWNFTLGIRDEGR